jgi:hypothetical protein
MRKTFCSKGRGRLGALTKVAPYSWATAAFANKQPIFFLPFVAVDAEAYARHKSLSLGERPCAISAFCCQRRALPI